MKNPRCIIHVGLRCARPNCYYYRTYVGVCVIPPFFFLRRALCAVQSSCTVLLRCARPTHALHASSYTRNKNFILKYFRCRDGKRTETRIGMEGICITHSCIPIYTVYMQHIMAHSGGMQEWVIQIPSIPILVSVLFPSLHLKYFRIKFLLLVCIVFMRMRTKPHPHPVIS